MTKQPKSPSELMGFVYGFLGIIIFSVALPATFDNFSIGDFVG